MKSNDNSVICGVTNADGWWVFFHHDNPTRRWSAQRVVSFVHEGIVSDDNFPYVSCRATLADGSYAVTYEGSNAFLLIHESEMSPMLLKAVMGQRVTLMQVEKDAEGGIAHEKRLTEIRSERESKKKTP